MKLSTNVSQSDKVCNMIIEMVEAKGIEVVLHETVCKDHINNEDMKKLKSQIEKGLKDGAIPLRNKDILDDETALNRYATNLLHDRLKFAKPINGNVAKAFKEPGKFKYSKNKEYKNLELSLAFLKSQNAPQEQLDEVTTLMLIKATEIEADTKVVTTPDLDLLPASVRAMIEAATQKKA